MHEYRCICGGNELAKVLLYHNIIQDTHILQQKVICPFHDDENPSMIVDIDKGNYFCFGCQESGDALTFVKKMYPKLNDLQACQKLYKILKSDKVSDVKFERSRKVKKDNEDLYNKAHDYYYGLSAVDWKKHSEQSEIVETKKYMYNRGFMLDTLNMCNAKVTYNSSYQLIFPILDNGVFRGWVCRTTKSEIEKKRKYLYNTGFSRRNTLVGDYGKKKYVYIVEGYMDRLKMLQHLDELGRAEDVVAIFGWKITDEQVNKLRSCGVEYVISALDNDECGRKGTEYLKTIFNVVRFCYLKDVKDIGETTIVQFKKMYDKTTKLCREMVK